MTWLQLPWKFNIPLQHLECIIDDNLKYVAHRGGRDGYTKTFNNVETTIVYDDWVDEKIWLSENYGDTLGTFHELFGEELDEITASSNGTLSCNWGIDENLDYLDRNQRSSSVMANDNSTVLASVPEDLENMLHDPKNPTYNFETDDGINLYRRLQNTMPCCVFPDNIGWQKIDIDTEYADLDVVEIKRLLATSDLTTIDSELLNKHFVLS